MNGRSYLDYRNNKGQTLFLSVLAAMIILIGLSASQFLKSIGENTSTRHDRDAIMALYAAEKGLEDVLFEFINSAPDSRNWFTHTFSGNDLARRSDGDPAIELSSVNEIDSEGYRSRANQSVEFVAKIYNDPPTGSVNEKIVLVLGRSGSKEKLIAARISLGSLYEYFMFSPANVLSFVSGTYNAQGGRIHANGNIYFYGGANIQNISQLSTAGYFNYGTHDYKVPMVDMTATPGVCVSGRGNGVTGMCVDANHKTLAQRYSDPTIVDGTTWAKIYLIDRASLPTQWAVGACSGLSDPTKCLFDVNFSHPDSKYYDSNKFLYTNDQSNGFLAGDNWDSKCYNSALGTYKNCKDVYRSVEGGATWLLADPLLDTTPYTNLTRGAKVTPYGSASPIYIPNRFDTEWTWAKYYYSDGNRGRYSTFGGQKYSYPPKNTYDPNNVESTCTDPQLCPQVKFTNTFYQADDWQDFLENQNGGVLKNVLMDANTGAATVSSPVLDASQFRSKASQEGIYIKNVIPSATFNAAGNFFNGYNIYYRDPAKTLECEACDRDGDGLANEQCCGKYQVIIKDDTTHPLLPDDQGRVIVKLKNGDDKVLFEKKGFYLNTSSLWTQTVVMNIDNIKAAIDDGTIALDTNFVYSDWSIAMSHAESMPTGGMTFVSEGDAFALGNVNTVSYQPSAVITPRRFWPLSSNFSFPQTVPDIGNHPDYPSYAPSSDNAPWREAHKVDLPNKVLADQVYNISIIGNIAADMDSLLSKTSAEELWSWKNNWTDAGEAYKKYGRTFTGTLLRLASDSFVGAYNYGKLDMSISRYCTQTECAASPHDPGYPFGAWKNCRGCSAYCTALNGWCPGNTVLLPSSSGESAAPYVSPLFQWEERYMTTGQLPPGDLPGVSMMGWILLNKTADNFDHRCMALVDFP